MQKLVFNKNKTKVLKIFKNNDNFKELLRVIKNFFQLLK